jgi:hypothetical protein
VEGAVPIKFDIAVSTYEVVDTAFELSCGDLVEDCKEFIVVIPFDPLYDNPDKFVLIVPTELCKFVMAVSSVACFP